MKQQQQLDDLRIYEVADGNGQFLMTAPMYAMRQILNLHRDACLRVQRETENSIAASTVHFNRQAPAFVTAGFVWISRR